MNTSFRQPRTLSLFSRVRGYLIASVALFLFAAVAVSSVYAAGTISGTAYRDFNGNGQQDSGEIGLENIQVEAFDPADVSQGTATTDANGDYSISAGGTGPYRVEFTIPTALSVYEPAATGSDNDSSVQFVPDGTTNDVNFGVNYPNDYCQNNPDLCVSSYVNGSRTHTSVDDLAAQYQWDYDYGTNTPSPTQTADTIEIGGTWGLALARTTKKLYTGAVLKRHVDIGPGDGAGSNPYGAIYVRDLGSTTNTYFTTIPDAGTVTGRDLTAGSAPSHDTDAYAKVGKVSLGGMTISDDETTLYVVNLNTRSVYPVSLSDGSVGAPLAVPDPGCTNGVYRPWAAKFWHGLLYVGVVCDASAGGTDANLTAHVFTYKPGDAGFNTTSVLSGALQMLPSKGNVAGSPAPSGIVNCNAGSPSNYSGDNGYHPWSDAGSQSTLATGAYYCRNSGASGNPHILVHPMPILTDIEFDVDGSMMLGIMDRFGNMIGWRNYGPEASDTTIYDVIVGGDVLRACFNGTLWVMESNGSCGGVTTDGEDNDEGIGGGEWYFGDETPVDGSQRESAEGGLAFVPGKQEVVSTAQDPWNFTIAQGVIFQSNGPTDPGANSDTGYQLYVNSTADETVPLFGKANGLGDLIALCDAAPVEIGNRVWNDTDGDGIQDADEPVLSGLDVTLWVDTDGDDEVDTQIATARTDANGNYYFSNDPRGYPVTGNDAPNDVTGDNGGYTNDGQGGRASTASHKYGLLGLTYDQEFEVRIDTTSAQNAPILTGLSLTTPNAGLKDTIDSDASMDGNSAVVAAATAGVGANNHTYDIGFAGALAEPLLGAIGNYVWVDEDSDGYQDEGEPGIPNVIVQLKNGNGGVIATLTTDSNGGYLFTDLPAGTYYVAADSTTIPTGLTQTTIYPNNGADFYNQNQSVGNGYQINLGAGEVNLTADFGYNWNPTNDVNTGGPANTVAALGDRIWIDSDGDGAQDDSEIGVSGVEVTIYGSPGPDETWGTNDDVPYTGGGYIPTRTTDENGNYMFDGLPPGQYLVRVTDSSSASHDVLGTQYTQTGDPDHFGTTGASNDNQTTIPVLLGPGDVFLNADFGYQPGGNGGSPELGSIGNFVWYDRDADGVGPTAGGEAQGAAPGDDNTEFGIGGVTVALIRDLNGNGQWDAGEPIIATTHTSDGTEDVDNDGNVDYLGYYNFRDLPVTDGVGTDDYIVWVNDTNNVLNGLRATYDQNGAAPGAGQVTGLGISSVANLTTTPVIDQDFGYTDEQVLDNPTNNGVLGDRVWLDTDGDGVQDAGEPGIPGVTVELYDSTGTTLIATTTTGFDGYYLFPNLETSAGGIEYVVRVDPTTLPGNLTQTYDFNGTGTPNESSRTLTDAEPIQLDQDFGYRGLGTIGNLVWNDINADGDQDAGELGIPGVTLDLYFDTNKNGLIDPGEPKLATQTTDANGGYLFTGLATETGTTGTAGYIVDVSDNAGVLTGFWHSLGANPNDTTDTNGAETQAISHNDPVPVLLTNAVPNNRNADFGYYVLPGAVGNYVWYDTDADGVQDVSEVGINDAVVTLEIRYPGQDGQLDTPDDTITTITTKTMTEPGGTRDGWYSFANLLQDEDYNGIGTYGTEPQHTITVTLPTGYSSSPTGQGTPTTDSNDPTGTSAQPFKGQINTLFANDSASISSYDFGIYKLELTGTVFLDIFNGTYNGNLDDPSETPNGGAQSGLTVNLYADDNNDGAPDGAAIASTVTDATGNYAFTGLEPGRYIVSVVLPATWRSTIDTYAPTDTGDPQEGVNNNDNGVGGVFGEVFSKTFNLIAGSTGANNVVDNATATTSNDRIDFGMIQSPTAAPELAAVSAHAADASSIRIKWKTLNERLVSGFNVQRGDSEQGSYINLNPELVSAKSSGSDLGKSYKFVDSTITAGASYWYRIELVRSDGTTAYSGAVPVTVSTEVCSAAPDKVEVVGPLKNAVVQAGKVKFKWKASNCAVTYKFRLRETNKKGTIILRKDGLTKPKTTFKKLEAGKSYVWRVMACGANGQCTSTKWRVFKVE